MYELHSLLAQSNVVRPNGLPPGRGRSHAALGPVVAWVAGANAAVVYLLLAVMALHNPLPEDWPLVSGPTTWTGLVSMATIIFLAVGGLLSACLWTFTHGSRRRFRPRQGRLLHV